MHSTFPSDHGFDTCECGIFSSHQGDVRICLAHEGGGRSVIGREGGDKMACISNEMTFAVVRMVDRCLLIRFLVDYPIPSEHHHDNDKCKQ